MEQDIQPVGQEVDSREELDTAEQGHREMSVQIHLHTHVFKRNRGLGHLCMFLLLCARNYAKNFTFTSFNCHDILPGR